ncbi:hypothetical protein [Tropicimonas sp. S265A]|uniref:hypothetical protein n=1 Tax=Tropicimonas sp. S265A TaxID=3415134 RepID=UPI003C7D4B70
MTIEWIIYGALLVFAVLLCRSAVVAIWPESVLGCWLEARSGVISDTVLGNGGDGDCGGGAGGGDCGGGDGGGGD